MGWVLIGVGLLAAATGVVGKLWGDRSWRWRLWSGMTALVYGVYLVLHGVR